MTRKQIIGLTLAHRRKMTQFERFITEGNEKADELAKAGAMMDEASMAEKWELGL